ncbi:MAG: amino acid ABC transporter permease, partial [Alphaproteobacteria bacterium]|nr:amino acid ABC transporter permease [Alphaproteobacteria bacterium]
FFMYGSYPRSEVWRVNLTLIAGGALAVWLLWPDAIGRAIGAFAFFAAYSVAAFGLLTGRSPFPTSLLPVEPSGQIALTVIMILALALGVTLFSVGRRAAAAACIGVVLWIITGASWHGLNLQPVGTELWGGIFVSLLVATVGIVFSLPLGIVLALGRRSQMPVIRFLCILLIEFVRGVPLITVLFMANTMLPLFVPQEWSPDRLLRPLIGVALFASVYMAEVVRGGLQAMPRGQYEGAMSLGLSWWQTMQLIILPQALVTVIPGIVNSFIALFKDTTLVAIVGIFDFLRAVDTQRLDPQWSGPTISTTGYVFAALFYFIFCFIMSRYALMMERRHAAGRKR